MGNAKAEKEELKKLEDEAYNELCQIIAEAMQFQDISLLDQRIADWKKKYKKLLDSGSPSSSNFKKRIEYLLNQFYSEITQYILKQIKKGEQKRIENQSKALRKLHYIINETDDLALLKKKVKEWEDKYPISGFITMYQKRIKIYTSEKYLKENAFDQDLAFRDLYYITKLNRTYDEFKEEISKWEDKYSIHNKYELDDFIKHQSEVNRYTSDEYLKSIAHADSSDNQDIVSSREKTSDSSLSKQSAAYSSLMSIARKPNNINEIFDWVYKYNSIKFNDEYKDLILRAIYLDYSPTYLNSLSVPKINLSSSLSFEEYKNIDEIKKYAVISYFNLLLPPGVRVSNNYFNENIEKIYRKSKTAHFSNEYDKVGKTLEKNTEIKIIPPETEVPELEINTSVGQVFSITNDIITSEKVIEENIGTVPEEPQILSSENTPEVEKKADQATLSVDEQLETALPTEDIFIEEEMPKQTEADSLTEQPTVKVKCEEPVSEKAQLEPLIATDESELVVPEVNEKSQYQNQNISKKDPETTTVELIESTEELKTPVANSSPELEEQNETLSNDTIIALSPSFFEIMNNKVHMQEQQATIVTMIDTHVENYMSMTSDKTNDISITRIDSN